MAASDDLNSVPITLKADVQRNFGFRCKTETEEVDRSHFARIKTLQQAI